MSHGYRCEGFHPGLFPHPLFDKPASRVFTFDGRNSSEYTPLTLQGLHSFSYPSENERAVTSASESWSPRQFADYTDCLLVSKREGTKQPSASDETSQARSARDIPLLPPSLHLFLPVFVVESHTYLQ